MPQPDHTMASRRLALAYALAPLATVPALLALSLLVARDSMSLREFIAGVEYPIFFFSFFGLPLAYLVELILVALVKAIGRNPETLHRRWILLFGALAGATAFATVFGFGRLVSTSEATVAGAVMGFAAGLMFSFIRGSTAIPGSAI